MYTLIYESEDLEFETKLEFSNFEELCQKDLKTQKVEELPNTSLYNNLGFGILILKPYNDDFLILYSTNKMLFQYFNLDLSEYAKGKIYGEIFPKFKSLHSFKRFNNVYNNNIRIDSKYKLYKDGNLIFSSSEFCIRQNDLLYIFSKNDTDKVLNEIKSKRLT